jgi:signal transduction histidine kinase
VYVDENMLDTVLRNLTTNALKFTPPDGRVTISAQPAAGSAGFVEISVSDTGVGISEGDQAKLFKLDQAKLFKLDQTHTTPGTAREQGSGLGLIICQEMVEKNGGQIWIKSEVGLDTSVKFTVPMAKDTLVELNNIQPVEVAV